MVPKSQIRFGCDGTEIATLLNGAEIAISVKWYGNRDIGEMVPKSQSDDAEMTISVKWYGNRNFGENRNRNFGEIHCGV